MGRKRQYLSGSDGSGHGGGVAGQRTEVTALRMSHDPAVLTTEIKFAKLCSSSTRTTELGLDYLKGGSRSR